MEQQKIRGKDRDLSILEYLNILQEEYIIAEFRSKIYYVVPDRNFYKRVMGYKKIRIEDISTKNKLSSIFNDKEEKEKFYNKFYGGSGIPVFKGLNETDLKMYYLEGQEVVCLSKEEKNFIGKIKTVNFEKNEVVVRNYLGAEETGTFGRVKRIF